MRKLFSVLSSTFQRGLRGGLLFLALMATTSLLAEDFSVGGIYYNILADKTNEVKVTYRGSSSSSYNEYYGAVTIPETVTYDGTTYSVTSIGYEAFSGCSSLTSITIPNSVTSIRYDAFQGCSQLASVTINSHAIVSNTYGLDGFNINYIFGGHVTEYIIGDDVMSIGSYAFYGSSSLISVNIGKSVRSIYGAAFDGCSSLISVNVDIDNTYYSSIDGVLFNKDKTMIVQYPIGKQSTSYIIPNSVTSIGGGAFDGCSKLTSVTIPNSVTSIGGGAFANCSSLTSITIPNSVTSIGVWAFQSCSSLTSITIPNNVTEIGGGAFYGCKKLKQCTLSENIISLLCYDHHFYGSYGFFEGCSSLTSITIPNSVTSIGGSAFYGCTSLTSITIPNSVTSIGDWAFSGCSALSSITCEAATPPTIGSSAFNGVSTSIPVYVPCGCVEAYKAVSGWNNFTNIQEPLAEYSIAVNVNDTIMGTAKVDNNNACGAQISATPNIGYHFVQWSDGNTDNPRTLELTQDTILTAEFAVSYSGQCGDNLYWAYDENNKTISITGSGDMYDYTKATQPWYLFQEQITEVTTSNTTTGIGTSAFEGCVRLAKVSLGSGMGNIAANAFAGCNRLYDIYCYASYPPFADESSFANYNVYVYIPCEYQRAYTLDVIWGKFKFIECIGADNVENTEDVTIIPGTNDVTITWPTEENAYHYIIEIKKDGVVFCTLTFNADGQLLNITFAPSRDGNNRPALYAEQVINGGLRFTVTGLEEGTNYSYDVITTDQQNQEISTHSGEFTTKGGTTTDLSNHSTPQKEAGLNTQKLLRDGQLLILRDGKTYNVMGAEIQ